MKSPFDDLGHTREPEPEGEEVTGAFSCQGDDCFLVVTTGRYLSANHVLTWKCPEGHLSKVDIDLDD